ncbi:MAG: hypothetical protein V3U80_05820 [Flavobacteriaceae bacterium]
MSLSGLKVKSIARKIERLLKKKKQESSLQISQSIKTVGILVNENSNFNFEKLKKLQRNIASGSDNFSILTCKTTIDSANEFRGVVLTEKDFSWNGSLKSNDVNNFLNIEFDMLIDYTKSETVYKKYLVAKSKAKFKVGYANVDERLYDLMLAVEDDVVMFNTELLRYLKILKKL